MTTIVQVTAPIGRTTVVRSHYCEKGRPNVVVGEVMETLVRGGENGTTQQFVVHDTYVIKEIYEDPLPE